MRALVGLLLAGGGLAVSAAERNTIVEPRLTLAEIYTDNVDHDVDARRRSDLVTQALPGIAVARRTPHSLLQLDYQLEGLVYARGTHSDHVYQRLFGNLHTEPVPDWFDLDAGAIIGQTIIDAAGTLSTSNVVGGRNRTEVRTYTLAPAFDHRFRGVHVHAGVRWQATRYQRGASDSDGRVYDLRLSDADHLPFLHWNLSYLDQKYDRKTTTDVHFRNLEGQVRYRLFRGFHLVARAGRADNAYQGVDDRRNGNYWAAGAGWQGRRFAVDVLDGRNDKGVTLGWTPNVRTQVDVTYRNRKVGRVHGPEWRGRITHRTRHTRLGFLYQESTQS
ncbi:MAG: TIGR03016 family PEP-CTERM system-associated outer membrane protein, partial [Gammaproteobacteria bacterium]